jgi:D-alanyl-lipoteichoic acid acyltransferase DltB (MBOAT superfamily)
MFESGIFWGALLVAMALSYVLPNEAKRLRALLLVIISLFVLSQLGILAWKLILLLAAGFLWLLIAIRVTGRIGDRNPFGASLLGILPLLLIWILGKQAVALDLPRLKFFYFVGFSFFLIKAFTFLKDFHDRRIPSVDVFVLAAYLFYFPTYVSGPMHLYGEFDQTIQQPKPLDSKSFVDVLFRLLLGLVKIKIVAPLLAPLSLVSLVAQGGGSLRQLIVGSFVYSIVIWADFSGYCDLAISTSRLIGLQTPENFNYPYLARSLRDFWQRWHITFSRVLTSYIFIPLSRKLQRSLGDRRTLIMITCYLVTFGFCGYWHGPTLNFTLWGLYHAAGLIVSDLLRPGATQRRLKRKQRGGRLEPLIQTLSVAVTFAYVSLGWILFVLPVPMIMRRG